MSAFAYARARVQSLVDALFQLMLTSAEGGLASGTRRAVAESGPASWLGALDVLAPHKVFPLIAYRLREHGLHATVPEEARARLAEMHEQVRARNALLMITLARVLRAASQRGEAPVLLKGILFADSYYPDFSTRPMSDLDLLAAPGRDEALFALLAELGFRPSFHHAVQRHSITFMNRAGVFCDAHRRLPMFDGEPWQAITYEIALQRIRGVRARVLEPNAMLAHLAAHMHGHAPELGPVLLWIVDLAFLLRRSAPELELTRVRRLMGSDHAWALLLRLVRLLEQAGEPMPAALARAARPVPALSLAALLRQRRITPWGLPAPLGWVRLLAHQLGLHHSDRPVPRLPDLVLWPVDELAARVAPPLARAALR